MHWDADPIIATLGTIELRWYGVLFATGLLLCAWQAPHYFARWGLPKDHAERLTLWVPIGMLLGAHYIHLIFYETEGLFDFHITVRSWWPPDIDVGRFWGLGSGLASHGGGLGCVLAVLAFWYRNGRPIGAGFHRYTDAVMVSSVWVYPFVRLGNFMNSEIWGRPTDSALGVIFDRRGFTEPRHPVQLYEATLYFCELAFAIWLQNRYARKLRSGAIFYLLLLTHFSLRFFAEFFKESQGVDEGWSLNMGHWLSLPIISVCAFLLLGTKRFSILTPLTPEEEAENARDYSLAGASAPAAGGDPSEDAEPGTATAPGEGAEAGAPRKKRKKKKGKTAPPAEAPG